MAAASRNGSGSPRNGDKGPLIYLVVGEPSGDQIGARLMRALKAKTGGRVRFAGLGGELMQAEGLDSLFPIDDLALIGVVELLPKLRSVFRRMDQVAADVRRRRPDVYLSIDAPAFGLRVAKRLKGEGVPLVHYVAPTVWAWAPWRAKMISRYLDYLLLLFAFEAPYFEKYGLETRFVGHAAAESALVQGDGPAFRKRHAIPPDVPVLAVLPGSRDGEINRHMAVLGDTIELLAARIPDLHCVVPTVYTVAERVEAETADWPCPTVVVRGAGEKHDAFAAADTALAASGTVTLEAALSGLPTVVFYRINPITAFFGKRIALTPFVNVFNFMAGKEILPELLQQRFKPRLLAEATERLMTDQTARREQLEAVERLRAQLLPPDGLPSERAADALLELIERHSRRDSRKKAGKGGSTAKKEPRDG